MAIQQPSDADRTIMSGRQVNAMQNEHTSHDNYQLNIRTNHKTKDPSLVDEKKNIIYHHLFDHAAGLAIEVAELGVLGDDLCGVDLGVTLDDGLPPLSALCLFEVDGDLLLVLQRPCRVVQLDLLCQRALLPCYFI